MESIRGNRSLTKETGIAGVETLGPIAGRDRQRDPALRIGKAEDGERLAGVAPGVKDEDALVRALDHVARCPRVGQRRNGPAQAQQLAVEGMERLMRPLPVKLRLHS